MREEREVLEDHAHLLAAEFLEGTARQGLHIDVVDPDMAVGDVVQLVDGTDRGRLAGPRQTHHDEDLTLGDLEVDIRQADHVLGEPLDLILR